jgi:uncharacterized protein YjiS (DUF1127 family)
MTHFASLASPRFPNAAAKTPMRRVMGYWDLWRSRQALKRLEDTALMDVGLTRAEAEAEANRHFGMRPRIGGNKRIVPGSLT